MSSAIGALLHGAQWRHHQDPRPGAAPSNGAALEVRDGQILSAHAVDRAPKLFKEPFKALTGGIDCIYISYDVF